MVIISTTDEKQLDQLLSQNESNLKILYFYIEDSAESNQMTDVINELDKIEENKSLTFIKINAKKSEGVTKKYDVESVPACCFYVNGNVIDKLVGANVPLFSKRLKGHLEKLNENVSEEDLDTRLKKLINKSPIMLFMKGNPDVPRCGFSKQVIALLDSHNAKFETFDILEDWDVREGLKKFSNWPTYPQLYINGDLVGGLDILKELAASGELQELFDAAK